MANSKNRVSADATPASSETPDCFVVMATGKSAEDRRWFQGWYREVIERAIVEAGYRPVLSVADNAPVAINDDIRARLAKDPMVVVDLGARTPPDDPNPNVMYELGIRHAFDLPVVIMANADQVLPFDVSGQRAVMESRDLDALQLNREKLVEAIQHARDGNYYKPMSAAGRAATLGRISDDQPELRALVEQIQEIRAEMRSIWTKRIDAEQRWRELTSDELRRFAALRNVTVHSDETGVGVSVPNVTLNLSAGPPEPKTPK